MPRTSKNEAPVTVDNPEIEIRQLDLDGCTVTFNSFKTDADPAPLFRGLPNDACQCPHWGTVLIGKLVFSYADHDETYTADDAYYGAPEHVPLSFAGEETIEFSPSAELLAMWTLAAGGPGDQRRGRRRLRARDHGQDRPSIDRNGPPLHP